MIRIEGRKDAVAHSGSIPPSINSHTQIILLYVYYLGRKYVLVQDGGDVQG